MRARLPVPTLEAGGRALGNISNIRADEVIRAEGRSASRFPGRVSSACQARRPRSLSAVGEHAQTDGVMRETDGFTYAIDEDGDLLWFISPRVYYRRRKREAEAAQPPAEPDS